MSIMVTTPSKRLGVILGTQRSGTTAVGRALGAEDSVAYLGEIFHAVRGPQDNVGYRKYLTEPAANFFTFRERLVGQFPALTYPSDSNQRAIWLLYKQHLFSLGESELWIVDVKYNSLHHLNPIWQEPLHWPGLLTILAGENTPVLHVVREDLFAQAISGEVATRTGRWHSTTQQPTPCDEPMVFDPQALESSMRSRSGAQRHVRNLLRSYPLADELIYEQAFIQDRLHPDACSAISDLFHLDQPITGVTDLRKIIDTPLSERIANTDEVRQHFLGSEFENLVGRHLGRVRSGSTRSVSP